MFWFGLKKRVYSLEIEIKRLNMSCVDNCCSIASLEKEVAALKEENKRLRTSSEYWRNRANHKKQKNTRRAALEKARKMDKDMRNDIRKAC